MKSCLYLIEYKNGYSDEMNKEVLQGKIDGYTQQLEDGKKKAGVVGRTKQGVMDKLQKAEDVYQMAVNGIIDLEKVVVDLTQDYDSRRLLWNSSLKKNCRNEAAKFDKYMNEKGFSGTVKFDHAARSVQSIAQTDALDETTQSTDIRQCSGGERSYTTFCLLLARGNVVSGNVVQCG